MDKIYYNICVYEPKKQTTSVVILRVQHQYQGAGVNKIGKQDEIELAGVDGRYQFNSEQIKDGEYIDYPKQISPSGTEFLGAVVSKFTELSQLDGSMVTINRQPVLVAKGGLWYRADDGRPANEAPRLASPAPELPGTQE